MNMHVHSDADYMQFHSFLGVKFVEFQFIIDAIALDVFSEQPEWGRGVIVPKSDVVSMYIRCNSGYVLGECQSYIWSLTSHISSTSIEFNIAHE